MATEISNIAEECDCCEVECPVPILQIKKFTANLYAEGYSIPGQNWRPAGDVSPIFKKREYILDHNYTASSADLVESLDLTRTELSVLPIRNAFQVAYKTTTFAGLFLHHYSTGTNTYDCDGGDVSYVRLTREVSYDYALNGARTGTNTFKDHDETTCGIDTTVEATNMGAPSFNTAVTQWSNQIGFDTQIHWTGFNYSHFSETNSAIRFNVRRPDSITINYIDPLTEADFDAAPLIYDDGVEYNVTHPDVLASKEYTMNPWDGTDYPRHLKVTKSEARWRIANNFEGSYYAIKYKIDTLVDDVITETAESVSEWLGPGDPHDSDSWLSEAVNIDPPEDDNETKDIIPIAYKCYHSAPWTNF